MLHHPYLLWIIVFVVLPSLFLWFRYGAYLKQFRNLFLFIGACAFVWGLAFDLVGNPILHIWSYEHTLGISIAGLPIEEYILLLTLSQEITGILLVVRKKIYG